MKNAYRLLLLNRGGLTPAQRLILRLQELGAILLYDGTLSGSNIANLGSGGSALDGTPTAITISDGMVANGTTSSIDAGVATALKTVYSTGFCNVFCFTATTGGEGGTGRLYNFGSSTGQQMSLSGGLIATIAFFDRATTDTDLRLLDLPEAFPSSKIIVFQQYDGTNRVLYGAKSGDSALSVATVNNAGSGAAVTPTGNLFILNRQDGANAFDGTLHWCSMGVPMTLPQMEEVAVLAGILNP